MRLVCALTFGLLIISQALASSCQPGECEPGFYKKGGGNSSCVQCAQNYCTAICNTAPRCQQCGQCGRNQEPTAICTCVCKKGFYWKNVHCQQCLSSGSSNYKNCYTENNCKDSTACRQILRKTTPSTFTTTSTTATTTTTMTERYSITSGKPPDHSYVGLGYMILVILLLLLVPVMYCVPVLYLRNLYKYLHLCPRWRDKQDTEAQVQPVTDHECLQNPTTVASICEETSMINVLSPGPSERPAHCAPLLPDRNHRALSDPDLSEPWPAIILYAVIKEVPLRRWKELLRLLSVADQQLERVELDAGLNSMERQYQMLRQWSQGSSAKMDDIYSALQYMELSGCAQMIKENLDKLQWRPQGGSN